MWQTLLIEQHFSGRTSSSLAQYSIAKAGAASQQRGRELQHYFCLSHDQPSWLTASLMVCDSCR